MPFAAVFSYEVDPAGAPAFEAVYGADGEWARFFRGGEGYLGTELWGSAPVGRYLVIDRWASAAAYVAFLSTQGEEYERRNRAASALYSSESVIGRFEVPG